jgi:predicted anti-sigma-YlaC factor YlaD
LDVFEELGPVDLREWQEHLRGCVRCRKEKERLRRLLEKTRESVEVPALSSDEARLFSERLFERIIAHRQKSRRIADLFKSPYGLLPAGAMALFIFIAIGWLALKQGPTSFSPTNVATLGKEDQMIAKDLDILRNMEFLQEMEDLQKLISVVDKNGV